MKHWFYSLPLALKQVMQKKEHEKCSLEKSLAQHLHLIATSAFGDFPADESFGCSIWDNDFDSVSSGRRLNEFIRQSILESIRIHEKRLGNIRVELFVCQEELVERMSGHHVKKRMDITVTGVVQFTNENFYYKDSFLVGPLSYLP